MKRNPLLIRRGKLVLTMAFRSNNWRSIVGRQFNFWFSGLNRRLIDLI